MNYTDYNISLDLYDISSREMLYMKVGDTNRRVKITLREGGIPFELGDGCRGTFAARKPDGSIVTMDFDITGNMIVFEIPEMFTNMEGKIDCEVLLQDGTRRMTTPRFHLLVDAVEAIA